MGEPARGDVYQGLLSALGNYRPVYVDNFDTGEHVHALDDGALKQAVTWVVDGYQVHVLAHHVWGVGGGPTAEFGQSRWKHRHIRWRGDGWTVNTENRVRGREL